MKPLRLRTSLTLMYTALLAVLLIGGALAFRQVLVAQVDRDATATLDEMARALHGYVDARDGRPAIVFDERDADVAAFVEEATRYYQVFDIGTRQLLVQSRGFAALGVRYAPDDVTRFAERLGHHDVVTERGRVRVSTTIVTPAPGVGFVLQVGLSLDQSDRSVASLERQLLWGIGLGLVASVLIGRWMAGRALTPLTRLARSTRDIDVATLSQRLAVRGTGDELDEVALAFNHTLDRLERSIADMRQFSAALAHELRTPLAILRGEAELALAKARGIEEIRRPLQTQLEEFDRLQHLVTQLLTLARAEAGQIVLARAPVDLAGLAASTTDQMEPVAESSGVSLSCAGAAAVIVSGDAGWLERLILILVDNAIKFTPAGGAIAVEVAADGDRGRLVVRDTGIGIPADAMAHVFKPFYRADPARSRSADGAGLGLALARWIVDQHGGTIEMTSQPGQGTSVAVRLRVMETGPDAAAGRGWSAGSGVPAAR